MTPYDIIKKDIILGNLKPNTIFNEKEYADKLNTSRTPIREAVLKLASEGYINIIPRKGTLISSISYQDIKELYEYRLLIEPNIYSLYKQEPPIEWINKWKEHFSKDIDSSNLNLDADDDELFHVELASFTNNEYLINQEKLLLEKSLRIRLLSNIKSKKRYIEAKDEHLQILEALKNNDYKKASLVSKKHLQNTLKGFAFLGE